MQLLNPIQSLRVPLRAELRLQACTFHAGGWYFSTKLSERFIARCWRLMQRLCHWHTKPMLRSAGLYNGAVLGAAQPPLETPTDHIAKATKANLRTMGLVNAHPA